MSQSSRNALPELPAWLQTSYTTPHIQSALSTLEEREETRLKLRVESARLAQSAEANQSLSSDSEQDNFYSVLTGALLENMRKNRYMDILPYERTRVHVGNATGNMPDVYLNANWVQEKYGGKLWIASQATLRQTAFTFLSMLLEDGGASLPSQSTLVHPRTIVQLTLNVESGRRKAHPYFPEIIGQTMIITPDASDSSSSASRSMKVTLLAQEEIEEACCVKSTVEIKPISNDRLHESSVSSSTFSDPDDSEDEYGDDVDGESGPSPTTFTHLLFYAWPDHSVPSPSDRAALFEFVKLVDKVNRSPSPSSGHRSPRNKNQNQNQNHQRHLDPNTNASTVIPGLSVDPPVIVGCSAGIGRTGSFIAISSLLRHAGFLPPPSNPAPSDNAPTTTQDERGSKAETLLDDTSTRSLGSSLPSLLPPLPSSLSTDLVVQEIDCLREQRPGMVQRPEQALLVYEMMVGAYVERRGERTRDAVGR